MSNYAVIKGASYILAAAPDMVLHNGTTQTTEMIVNPESEYLKELPEHLRSYEDVLSYIPNQVYIGNMTSRELGETEFPWYDKKAAEPKRQGRFGEIMPQDEFLGLMQICDVFDLVKLEPAFAQSVKEKLTAHGMLKAEQISVLDKNADGIEEIERLISEEHAEGLYHEGKLVGAVKRAHDVDVNLSAHTMLENIVTKASSVLAILHLLRVTGIAPGEVDYVIDCCEEACGDMNQRGGGNFAKAAAEVAGLTGATGSDVRGFCAGPSHALLDAASLVKAGTFKNVVVTAGGCTAKLGMNGKDHVKKGLPVLEDCIGGFAVLISENDGVNPVIRTDIVGRHAVGTGSSPQAVISSLVTDPLEKAGLKITDVDKYAPELQNPDITKPAGAGDVPEANYKMIAALGVKRGDIQRADLANFVKAHGMTGWAPTQGHIPSGVPYVGFCREEILAGETQRAMIIGKGSLFLGRMTNLFDGISFIIEKNAGKEEEGGVSEEQIKSLIGEAMRDFAASLLKQ
ncbi:MAG: glycine/sarcosine/betaine reductase complex component C subunit beta [Anaerovoracaceae bacterium]